MKRFLTCRIIALAVLLTSCAPVTDRLSKVVRIIDGDTIEIAGGIRIRYFGIDAPEVYTRGEAYGREASAANREFVEGEAVAGSLLSKVRLVSGIRHRERRGWRI